MSRQVTLAGQAPAGQPTPGPWTFLEDGDAEALHNCRPLTICSPSKDDLAEVFSEEDSTVAIPRQQAIANARMIVRAVNCHAELVEALRNLLADVDNPASDTEPASHMQARTALSRATGSQP